MSLSSHRWRRPALALLAAAALFTALVTAAFAHAEPSIISPGDGAVLSTAPTAVTMQTTEKMTTNPGDNTLVVVDASGTTVTTAAATVDPTTQSTLSVGLPAGLAVGTYTVKWATVSAADGDHASGSWTFTYDPSKTPTAGRTNLIASTTTPPVLPTATPTPAAATAAATPTPTVVAQPAATGMAGLAATAPTGQLTVLLLAAAAAAAVVGGRALGRRR